MIPYTDGIFHKKDARGRVKLFTQNLTPGIIYFDEETENFRGREYRNLDIRRSKLAAAIAKGLKQTGLKQGDNVLYLGASHGYTPSFISDIVGERGFVFALDFAPRVVRDLVFLCESRENMTALLADAAHPELYRERIFPVDYLYQDIAQKNQAEIFIKNSLLFLKQGGYGFLAVKSRSVDITKRPSEVYSEVRKKLEQNFKIIDYKVLDPFEKDHCAFVVKNSH